MEYLEALQAVLDTIYIYKQVPLNTLHEKNKIIEFDFDTIIEHLRIDGNITVGTTQEDKNTWIEYINITESGKSFCRLRGYSKQLEREERENRILELTEDLHEHSKQALDIAQKSEAIGRENIGLTAIGLIWIITGVVLSVIAILIALFK